MARRGPEVIEGPRSPLTDPQRQYDDLPHGSIPALPLLNVQAEAPRSDKPHRFGASARGYQMNLKRMLPTPVLNQDTGKLETFEILKVTFQDGIYETDDDRIADLIRKSKAFKGGLDLWDVDELAAKGRRKQTDNFLEQIDKLEPELKDKLRAKLGMTDFPAETPAPA